MIDNKGILVTIDSYEKKKNVTHSHLYVELFVEFYLYFMFFIFYFGNLLYV